MAGCDWAAWKVCEEWSWKLWAMTFKWTSGRIFTWARSFRRCSTTCRAFSEYHLTSTCSVSRQHSTSELLLFSEQRRLMHRELAPTWTRLSNSGKLFFVNWFDKLRMETSTRSSDQFSRKQQMQLFMMSPDFVNCDSHFAMVFLLADISTSMRCGFRTISLLKFSRLSCTLSKYDLFPTSFTDTVPIVWLFTMTLCNFQVQYGYVVVQMLMEHLDHNSHESAKIKASVVGVLSEIVDISAGGSIGLSHLSRQTVWRKKG